MRMVPPPAEQMRQPELPKTESALSRWKSEKRGKFIHERADEKLGLTKVAKSVNISANHLSEKFKQLTG